VRDPASIQKRLRRIDSMSPAPPQTPGPLPRRLKVVMACAGAVLFAVSTWRHWAQHSTAFDLGVYDQALYLISRGESPVSSFLGFHILGDHVAVAVYPLALLYAVYPTALWLFVVQAACLAAGVGLTWRLARAYDVPDGMAEALAVAYLLHPVVYNLNLFDFHPDALALPGFLAAIIAAKENRPALFTVSTLWILACKAPFSLTVVALGVWLLIFERKTRLGAFATIAGSAWFLATTQWIIPRLSGGEAIGVSRFAYLGDSVFSVMVGVVSQPGLVLDQVLRVPTLVYLFLLAVVFVWWVSPRNLIVLLPAVPTVVLNVLGVDPKQRTLAYQYSLPVVPFLLLAVVRSLSSSGRTFAHVLAGSIFERGASGWRKSRWGSRAMILWAMLMLAWLGRWSGTAEQLSRPATWAAVREWVDHLPADASVLTDNRLAPQMTHRAEVYLVAEEWPWSPPPVDYVLLDLTEPWTDSREVAERVVEGLVEDARYERLGMNNGVHLFRRR
jgi:uncharacterized membrane protein